jgi:hypothetical protein
MSEQCNCLMCLKLGAFGRHRPRTDPPPPPPRPASTNALAPVALALAALFTGCAADEPADDHECAGVQPRFAVRPVRVEASSDMPDDCVEATIAAVDFWRARDVTMALSMVPPTAPSLGEQHVAGVISVKWGQLPDPVAGETKASRTILCDIFGAKVTLELCTPMVAIHEVAHALGLEHDPEVGNVMFKFVEGMGLDLNAAQLAWVADPALSVSVQP